MGLAEEFQAAGLLLANLPVERAPAAAERQCAKLLERIRAEGVPLSGLAGLLEKVRSMPWTGDQREQLTEALCAAASDAGTGGSKRRVATQNFVALHAYMPQTFWFGQATFQQATTAVVRQAYALGCRHPDELTLKMMATICLVKVSTHAEIEAMSWEQKQAMVPNLKQHWLATYGRCTGEAGSPTKLPDCPEEMERECRLKR